MKNILLLISFVLAFSFSSCDKSEPVIADINELPIISLSERLISQPIGYTSGMVGIVSVGNQPYLTNYNSEGGKNWQQSLEAYSLAGNTVDDVEFLDLNRDAQGNYNIRMYQSVLDNSEQLLNQYINIVRYTESGLFSGQLADSIHQPDTVIIGIDTIDVTTNDPFLTGDFVSFSSGNYASVSSQISVDIDSTFLQLTNYNNSGTFFGNNYLKLDGSWVIKRAFVNSDNNLLLFMESETEGKAFKLISTAGNILFEFFPSENINQIYFFFQTNEGNYIISALTRNGNTRQGIVYCLNQSGSELWSLAAPYGSGNAFIHSVNEQSTGLLFTGIISDTPLRDWRNEIDTESFSAFLLKTDLNGSVQWESDINTSYNSVGAVTVGSDHFNFFMSKRDGADSNIILLKLDRNGDIRF